MAHPWIIWMENRQTSTLILIHRLVQALWPRGRNRPHVDSLVALLVEKGLSEQKEKWPASTRELHCWLVLGFRLGVRDLERLQVYSKDVRWWAEWRRVTAFTDLNQAEADSGRKTGAVKQSAVIVCKKKILYLDGVVIICLLLVILTLAWWFFAGFAAGQRPHSSESVIRNWSRSRWGPLHFGSAYWHGNGYSMDPPFNLFEILSITTYQLISLSRFLAFMKICLGYNMCITPEKAGEYGYSCGMNAMHGHMIVE